MRPDARRRRLLYVSTGCGSAGADTARRECAIENQTAKRVVDDRTRTRRVLNGSESGVVMHARRHSRSATASRAPPVYLEIESYAELWKLDQVAEMLKASKLGVIPTDSTYSFVCSLSNRDGIERMYRLKDAVGTKKPMSILCSNLSMVQKYTVAMDKKLYKMLRAALPGPYTFVLPATNEVPRVMLEHKSHRKLWKRREIGVRIPDDELVLELMERLDEPLLVASTSMDKDAESRSPMLLCAANVSDTWCSQVDFIVDNGMREVSSSTVIDCTHIPFHVIREGRGSLDILPPDMRD
mmetsp:Transcript_6243/g.13323  ORF Transcript_6243/g.13323 Transcript_6243/m.13323 type:complete len:297 (+) Transcript_6243:59-949(+)|eukprot:CAMPEP_0185850194 /NCGR_PEP_ID=MMETSP1354-20130828/4422_1 /TAXON_ID=708628 /ORGANISM="Erythrolobus madagascarensis, Strain CCMP3276" /LENGTH=296 /DNA_ID=CAMNT_0028550841 /DNA_START=36 /DNA_END=926 /DNA_ORIENTATION=+